MENIVLEERNDARGRYLVAVGHAAGGYKEEMLKNSRIPGLLGVTGQDFNGQHELWYDTTAKQALKVKFAQKAPGIHEIMDLMQQLGELAQRMEEYLLEPEEIVAGLSYIFEGEKKELQFLYLPGYPKESVGGVCRLLEELMEYVDYEDHRAVSFLYLLHARSRQQACGIFSLHSLCEEIAQAEMAEEERRESDDLFGGLEETGQVPDEKNKASWRSTIAGKWKNKESKGEENFQKSKDLQKSKDFSESRDFPKKKNFPIDREVTKKEEAQKKKGKMSGNFSFQSLLKKIKNYISTDTKEDDMEEIPEEYEDFGRDGTDAILPVQEECLETVLLTGESETVLLTGDMGMAYLQERYRLEPVEKGREAILLKSFPFCIGKDETGSGCALKEPVISRRHAKILKEGMQYFLVDTRSLNGTYLNGERIAADEKKELKEGDRVDFADICFIFTCC